MNAKAALLPDGRLHLQHGPIDLIIRAWGADGAVRDAYRAARDAFNGMLSSLARELPLLRTPLGDAPPRLDGPVARRMARACWPYRADFITPMAAVAGAVADHVLAAMLAAAPLDRAFVNDGGDIAFHVTPGHALTLGLVADVTRPAIDARATFTADITARGIATSGRACKGRGGRSFSLGIADAVTVLARDAAAADAAATVIANAVDLPGHPAVTRVPASSVDPDSDLGERLVTWDVGALADREIDAALAAGRAKAQALLRAGLITGAYLALRGRMATAQSQLRAA